MKVEMNGENYKYRYIHSFCSLELKGREQLGNGDVRIIST
jgi:hypothetical protein